MPLTIQGPKLDQIVSSTEKYKIAAICGYVRTVTCYENKQNTKLNENFH